MGRENVPVLSVYVYHYGLGLVTAFLLEVYGFYGSLPSFQGENHPDPKSNRDLDPDNPICNTSCRGKIQFNLTSTCSGKLA